MEWLSKLSTGCGLLELTSNRRICGLPAAASSCLSVVISSLLTCAMRCPCSRGLSQIPLVAAIKVRRISVIALDVAAKAYAKHQKPPSRRWNYILVDLRHAVYRLALLPLPAAVPGYVLSFVPLKVLVQTSAEQHGSPKTDAGTRGLNLVLLSHKAKRVCTAAALGAPASLHIAACGSRCRWSPPRIGLCGRTRLLPAQPASPGAPLRINAFPATEHAGHWPSDAAACGGARARHAACSAGTPSLQTSGRVLFPSFCWSSDCCCSLVCSGESPVEQPSTRTPAKRGKAIPP